jgi:anti-sigma regulatory factor (Ser/Thr protein kinase)
VSSSAGRAVLRHRALVYYSPGDLADVVGGFVAAGVRAGEPVLAPLHAAGPLPGEPGGRNGLVTWYDADRLAPSRFIGQLHDFCRQHPGQRFRYVHEPTRPPGRPPAELREVIRHEALVGLALQGSSAHVLCCYDARVYRRLADGIWRTHSQVIAPGSSQPAPRRPAEAPGSGLSPPLAPIPADAASLSYRLDQAAARQFTAVCARSAGLPERKVSDVVLAVSELTANTVAHTSGPGTLAIWAAGHELICQVTDSGWITDPLAGQISPGLGAAEGGRGLWVVSQLCDLVERRTGPAGTTTRIHIAS